jgi:RNA polymerase sigma-70 factor, ECF subfamily
VKFVEELTSEGIEIVDYTSLLDEIMDTYGQEILHLVYTYVNNKELAEDLTQEVFIKCYNSINTFKGNSKLRTWLWKIAINHCKDYLKSWYNNKIVISGNIELFERVPKESVEQTVLQKNDDDTLVSAVLSLPIKYREVIYLYYFKEVTIKEISNIIGIKQNTIKTRLRKAKELLRKRLEEIPSE